MKQHSKFFSGDNKLSQISFGLGLGLVISVLIGNIIDFDSTLCLFRESYLPLILSVASLLLGAIVLIKRKTKEGVVGVLGGLIALLYISFTYSINFSCMFQSFCI